MTQINGWLGTKRGDQQLVRKEVCFAIVAGTGAEIVRAKEENWSLAFCEVDLGQTRNKWAEFYIQQLGL